MTRQYQNPRKFKHAIDLEADVPAGGEADASAGEDADTPAESDVDVAAGGVEVAAGGVEVTLVVGLLGPPLFLLILLTSGLCPNLPLWRNFPMVLSLFPRLTCPSRANKSMSVLLIE